MLPNEIDPCEFKFFKKDMLPSSEIYKLFKGSRLLNANETVKAISMTNQGLVVLTRRPKETIIYTPESKISYPAGNKKLAPEDVIPQFLNTKMLDFLVLRFKNFYCCLSRKDKSVCGFYIMTYSDKENGLLRPEDALINPSGILGNVTETVSTTEDTNFKFEDLKRFGKMVSGPKNHYTPSHGPKMPQANNFSEKDSTTNSEKFSSVSDLKLNPIDIHATKDTLDLEKGIYSIGINKGVKGDRAELAVSEDKASRFGKERHSINKDGYSTPFLCEKNRVQSSIFSNPNASDRKLENTSDSVGSGDAVTKDSNCCIEVTPGSENNIRESPYSEPYKDVGDNEEGLFDYITSKVFEIIGDDASKKKNKPWKVVEGKETTDWSSETDGDSDDEEDEDDEEEENDGERESFTSVNSLEKEERPSLPLDNAKVENKINAKEDPKQEDKRKKRDDKKKRRKSSNKCPKDKSGPESIIRFGLLRNNKLEYVQKRIKPLSMVNFDRLEAFITKAVKYLRKSDANYIEVCSEIDFFIMKRGSICLYVRDLVHKREGRFLRKFSKMLKNLSIK